MDELDLILMERLEEAEQIDRFQFSLKFNLERAIMDEMTEALTLELIESREMEQMIKAKEIIDQNTPKPPHKQFNEFIKTHGL